MDQPIFTQDWYSNDLCRELQSLYTIVKDLKGLVIENGCWEGKSTVSLANVCYPEVLICNDTWQGNINEGIIAGREHITVELLKTQNVYQTFIENMDKFTKGNYKVVKEDCMSWMPTIEESVKFCHIDADHEYAFVRDTLVLMVPKMVKGGIICGDDYGYGDVFRAVHETFGNKVGVIRGKLWYWINN